MTKDEAITVIEDAIEDCEIMKKIEGKSITTGSYTFSYGEERTRESFERWSKRIIAFKAAILALGAIPKEHIVEFDEFGQRKWVKNEQAKIVKRRNLFDMLKSVDNCIIAKIRRKK